MTSETPEKTADAATSGAEPSVAQSGAEFRRVIAESAGDIEDLNYVATNVLYARGALAKDIRRAAVKAIRSYQTILAVARDPEGILGHPTVSADPGGSHE